MSKDKNITLSICGNPDANMGYQQLIAIEPAFYPEDKQYPAVNLNDSYYSLQIRPDVTVLIKTVNNVCSYGSSREGRLRIGISIPCGLCVNNPKALIDEIETVFKLNYMTSGLKWQFKESEYDTSIFQAIIAKHLLRPSASIQRAMTTVNGPIGYVYTSKVEELLSDYQYREFQPYGEIIIAETGSPAPNVINSLAIPRQPIYDIRLQQPGCAITEIEPIIDINKKCMFSIPPTNSSVFETIIVDFTISELKMANSGDKSYDWGMVSLDEKQETVTIIVKKFPEKKLQCRLTTTGDNIELSKIQLKCENRIIPLSNKGNFILSGLEITNSWHVTCPSDSSYSFFPSTLLFGMGQPIQSITVKESRPLPPIPGPEPPSGYSKISLKATILNPTEDMDRLDATAIFTILDGKMEYACPVTLKKDNKPRHEGKNECQDYKGEFDVPKELLHRNYDVRVTVPEFDIHFKEENIALDPKTTINIGEDRPGSGLKKTMPMLFAIILAAIMLLVGAGCGWGIAYWQYKQELDKLKVSIEEKENKHDVEEISEQTEDTCEECGTPAAEMLSDATQKAAQEATQKIKDEYENKLKHIQSLSFKFAEIDNYEKFLKDPEAKKIDDEAPSLINKLSHQLLFAKKVQRMIDSAKGKGCSPQNIKNEFEQDVATANKEIPQIIKLSILSAYKGDYRNSNDKKDYSLIQANTAAECFKDCKSYQDLYDISKSVITK